MFSILWVFLQSAAVHIWYAALHLESGSFPRPLSPAQEQAAFSAMHKGDTAARDSLISHNLRLVAVLCYNKEKTVRRDFYERQPKDCRLNPKKNYCRPKKE